MERVRVVLQDSRRAGESCYVATHLNSVPLVLKQHLSASCGSPSLDRVSKKV